MVRLKYNGNCSCNQYKYEIGWLPHEIAAKVHELNQEYRKHYIELMPFKAEREAYEAVIDECPAFYPAPKHSKK